MTDIYKLENPFGHSFVFRWNSRPFSIPGMGAKLLPQPIAMHGAKKIAEQVLRQQGRDADVIRDDVMKQEMSKLVSLYQAAEANVEDPLGDRLAELNPNSDESDSDLVISEEEAKEAESERVEKEAEVNAFSEMNQEELNEQDRLEALKANNPKGYLAEVLNERTKAELIDLAEEHKIEIENPKVTKPELIETLVNAGVDFGL